MKKMVKLKSWKVFAILFEIFLRISASTHWIVTENGLVQSQLDSAFHLRRPYDLLALLDQENRVKNINVLYRELVSRKIAIDHQWASLETVTDLETRLYSQDLDCLKAGKPLADTDLYASIAGDYQERFNLHEFFDEVSVEHAEPICSGDNGPTFSMDMFDHLHAMVVRSNLTSLPEPALATSIPFFKDNYFASRIADGLKHNKSSCVHYNLASIYWRIQGNAPNAIECARYAVHFSPRQYRDLALLSLGSIFHHAKFPAEAAIILHASVDHSPQTPNGHFALGNVYAILGDYNRSIACYDNALKLRPQWEKVSRTRHSVLCHRKLEKGLLDLHEALQGILAELHDYHDQQQRWLAHQEKLVWEQAPLEVRLLGHDHSSLAQILSSRGQSCVQRLQEGRTILSCDVNSNSQLLAHSLQIDITLSLQMLLKNVETQAKMISDQMSRRSQIASRENYLEKHSPNEENLSSDAAEQTKRDLGILELYQKPTLPAKYLTQGPKHSHNSKHAAKEKEPNSQENENWPSREECAKKLISVDKFPQIFLPPENKGFEPHMYLTDLIDLSGGAEHALPWYPPVCDPPGGKKSARVKRHVPAVLASVLAEVQEQNEPHLVQQLAKYVSNPKSEQAEIGQRILTAINKEVGPDWLLRTLASLYWRIRGNSRNSLECLQSALVKVPKEYEDVVLVSLGSLLHRLGHTNEALLAANEAYNINNQEPATKFLLSTILASKKNYSGAIHHLRAISRAASDYLGGVADKYAVALGCARRWRAERPAEAPPAHPQEMCDSAAGGGSMGGGGGGSHLKDGDTVICSPDGENCKAVQCFSTNHDTGDMRTLEKSAVSRLLGSGQCGGGGGLLGSLLASKLPEHPDETELERMSDDQFLKQYNLKISLGDEEMIEGSPPLDDFYVTVSLSDPPMNNVWINDKNGAHPLSPADCERLKNIDNTNLNNDLYNAAFRNLDVVAQLQAGAGSAAAGAAGAGSGTAGSAPEPRQPLCDPSLRPLPQTLDNLPGVKSRHRLQSSAETGLTKWFVSLGGDEHSSAEKLGTRIAIALQENATSWVLATAAALYWRVVGHADQAVTCLRQALQYVPTSERDIPLNNLATVLLRAGFTGDALVVANMAVELAPKIEINHFTLANIHAAMGDLDKAIAYYRTTLALKPDFTLARYQLQSVLCALLFED